MTKRQRAKLNKDISFRYVEPKAAQRYVTCVPLIPLEVAAAAFRDSQPFDEDECNWVEIKGGPKPARGLFVAQVVTESINRRIPNGTWCLWRSAPGDTPAGTIVLAQNRDIKDPELGGDYTVRVLTFHIAETDYGHVTYENVFLEPDSSDPSFTFINCPNLDYRDDCVVAVFVATLKAELAEVL